MRKIMLTNEWVKDFMFKLTLVFGLNGCCQVNYSEIARIDL